MRLLLRSDVEGLGRRGEIVDVADGYARNYLVPQGLGMRATESMASQAEAMRRRDSEQNAADRSGAEDIATTIVPMIFTVTAKASAEGRLFGSVGAAEVSAAVAAQADIVIEPRQISDEPIKETGQHRFMAKLHPEVEFPITFDVVAADQA